MKTTLTVAALALGVSSAMAADVNPDVIFGSGNANGSFTVDTGSGVELGLRAKVRYNSSGSPENTFNWDGTDTYTFNPNNGNPAANRAMWNFEWSVNTDVEDTTGNNLNDFTYELSLFKVNADGTNIADALTFDPINATYADHAIGDNTTGNGDGVSAADATAYASMISSKNVAQNSWNYGFFNGSGFGVLEGIDPSAVGSYIIRLTAFDGYMMEVASTEITVNVVPVPTAAFAGLGLLGSLAGIRAIRRR